jgi:hypothetical protein
MLHVNVVTAINGKQGSWWIVDAICLVNIVVLLLEWIKLAMEAVIMRLASAGATRGNVQAHMATTVSKAFLTSYQAT